MRRAVIGFIFMAAVLLMASAQSNPEQAVQRALDPQLSLQHRRYLLYLYARINDPAMAEQLARPILDANPADKQTLLVLASMYVERKDGLAALRISKTLAEKYPTDHQALYFLAASHTLLGHHETAATILGELKIDRFNHKKYPYEIDLASAALQSGDWFRAMLAYQEVLRHHSIGEELRLKTRAVLERIYREHLPTLAMDVTSSQLKQGGILRARAEYQRHLTEGVQTFARLTRFDTEVKAHDVIRNVNSVVHDGWVGIRGIKDRTWEAEAWVGGTDGGALGGASLKRLFGNQRSFKLSFQGNQRATDGLLFEALDGREDRLVLDVEYMIKRDWVATAQLYGRNLSLNQRHFGWSQGGSWNLEYILRHDLPEIRLGVRAYWMGFSASAQDIRSADAFAVPTASAVQKQAALANLVAPQIHREGAYLTIRDQISSMLFYHFTGGLDYAFDRSSIEGNISGGFSFFPRKSMEIRASTGYASSARSSDSGSDLLQFEIGLKYWF